MHLACTKAYVCRCVFVPERCGFGSLTSKGIVNVASPLIIAFAIRCCNVIVLSIRCSQGIRGRIGLAVVQLSFVRV